jgi:hypothetical protein
MPSVFEYLFRWGGQLGVVALLLGLTTAIAAGLFTWKPRPRKLGFIGSMAAATFFAALAGVATGASKVLVVTARFAAEMPEEWPRVLVKGLGEALVPAVSGFTSLALAAVLVALGIGRMPDGRPPQGSAEKR